MRDLIETTPGWDRLAASINGWEKLWLVAGTSAAMAASNEGMINKHALAAHRKRVRRIMGRYSYTNRQ